MSRERARRASVLALAGTAAVAAWWRVRGEERPYGPRWLSDAPRARLSRGGLVRILRPAPGERVLEVGPGYGYYTARVAREMGPGGTLEILEPRQTLLDQTLERTARAGLANVRGTRGDGRALPYPDGHFDAAFLVACLGEIADPARAVRELARVLRPGGRLVVGEAAADPHRVSLAELVEHAERAGLRAGPRAGRLSYYARFDRPG